MNYYTLCSLLLGYPSGPFKSQYLIATPTILGVLLLGCLVYNGLLEVTSLSQSLSCPIPRISGWYRAWVIKKDSEHSVAHICVPYLPTFVDVYVYINYSGTYSVRPDCGWFEVNRTPYHGVKVFMATLAWHLSKTPLSHGACSCLSNMLEELVHLTLYYLKTNSKASHESGSSCALNSLEKKLNLVLRTVNYAYH